MAYDVIGDIHGHADQLEALLAKLEYICNAGVWQHPERKAIFLGDFIDRGPRQRDTLRLVRAMIDGGHARAVMGNHEFNAIAYFLPDPARPGEHLRSRSKESNRRQHAAFLNEITLDSVEHAEWVDWFLTLPLWLDLDGIRIVHACWHPEMIARTEALLGGSHLTRATMVEACTRGEGRGCFAADGSPLNAGSELFHCIETLLKGIEIDLPDGLSFMDKDKKVRTSARIRWWMDAPTTYREGAIIAGEDPSLLSDDPLPQAVLLDHDGGSPILIGHYWMSGDIVPLSKRHACVDYSVAKSGPLVAYRWDGELELDPRKFIATTARGPT